MRKGHNYGLCKKCGKTHEPPRGMLGKKHTDEARKAISTMLKGRKFSEESKKRMSEAKKGKMPKSFSIKKVNFKGRKHSAETRQKMSETQKKVWVNPEWRARNTKSLQKSWNNLERRKRASLQMSVRLGEKNPNWKGGITNNPYPLDFNEKLKNKVKQRDKQRCQFPDCDQNNVLSVHHINYNKNNNEVSNLITLCMPHNSKVNGNRQYWENYFKRMVEVFI